MNMRIAFFGGTFDPPHCGHLGIAQAAASRLHLDEVLFAPVGAQPHKIPAPAMNGPAPTSFADRVAMVRLAIAGNPGFHLSLIDAPREDGQPNYTLHALARLKAILSQGDRLFCLVGADSFLTLPKWYRADELLFACDFIVAGRPGFSLDDLAPSLPAGILIESEQHSDDTLRYTLTADHQLTPSHLYLLPDLDEDLSATRIRSALSLANEGSTDGHEETVLPASVVAYIHAHGLYRAHGPYR